MKNPFFFLFLLSLVPTVHAEIALDSSYLETILLEHPDDIETRLLLASYYLNAGDFKKSETLIVEALKQEEDNKMALNLQDKLIEEKESQQLLKKLNIIGLKDTSAIDQVIENLYKEKKYKLLSKLFNITTEKNIALSRSSRVVYVSLLVDQKKYTQAWEEIKLIENKYDERIQKLMATTCHALENFECATHSLENLYNSSGDLEIGLQLADTLIQQGRILDAKKVSAEITKNNVNNPKAITLSKRVAGLFEQRVDIAKKKYQGNTTITHVKELTQSLMQSGDKEKASAVLLQFIKEHPENDEIKLFSAKQLASEKKLDEAISMLQSIKQQSPESQVLLAKYLAWTGDNAEKAQTILKKVLAQAKLNKDSAYSGAVISDATLLLGNTYLWQGKKLKAQKILAPLVKNEPANREAKEAYLLAKNKYDPLIDRYEKQLNSDPDNAQVILRLANLYEVSKYNAKALKYYERYRTIHRTDIKVEKAMGLLYLTQKKYDLGFKFLKRHAYREHSKKSLLNLANNYHWNGFNEKSLEVIRKLQAYYPNSSQAAKLKEKVLNGPLAGRDKSLVSGNKAYQASNFKVAVPLYKKYLNSYPADYFVRHKYAYALGQIGSYSNAVKEFFKITQARPDDLNIQYHYAFNLEQSEKQQKAKEIYNSIIEKTKKASRLNAFSDKEKVANAKLSELASARLDILEKNKDVVVNGIYLGGGVKKVLSPEKEVLSDSFVTPILLSQNKINSSFVTEDVLYYSPRDTKIIELDYQHSSDRVGVNFNSPRIKAQYNSWPYEMNFSGGGFTFEDELCDEEFGGSVELSGMYKKSTSFQYGAGLRVDEFDGKTEFSPFINAKLLFDKSNVDIQLYKRPLFYEKLACGALKKHINRYGVQVSGNIEFTKKQALWYSVDAGYIDDSNIEVLPQFNLIVYRDKFKNRYIPIDYEFSIEGYYMWNRRQTDEYYSPEIFDSTSLSFRPVFKVNKNLDLMSSVAVGYSVDVGSVIFRYGAWAQYSINKGLKAKAGCERSNVGSANAGGKDYHSNNCLATLQYEWK